MHQYDTELIRAKESVRTHMSAMIHTLESYNENKAPNSRLTRSKIRDILNTELDNSMRKFEEDEVFTRLSKKIEDRLLLMSRKFNPDFIYGIKTTYMFEYAGLKTSWYSVDNIISVYATEKRKDILSQMELLAVRLKSEINTIAGTFV